MDQLYGLPFGRVVEVRGGDWAGLLAAALTAHQGQTVVMAWVRPPCEPVRVLAGGALAQITTSMGTVEPVEAGTVPAMLRQVDSWTRCAGTFDPLAAKETGERANIPVPWLEDVLTNPGSGPVGWLVVAEPVPTTEVEEQAAQIAAKRPRWVHDHGELADALQFARVGARHRSLVAAASAGAWRVHVLAGGPDPTQARCIAGSWCAAAMADSDVSPWLLRPGGEPYELDKAWATSVVGDDPAGGSPFVVGSRLLAAIVRLPVRELPGVRLVEPSAFDLTPETTGDDSAGQVPLGTVVDGSGQPAGQFNVSPRGTASLAVRLGGGRARGNRDAFGGSGQLPGRFHRRCTIA